MSLGSGDALGRGDALGDGEMTAAPLAEGEGADPAHPATSTSVSTVELSKPRIEAAYCAAPPSATRPLQRPVSSVVRRPLRRAGEDGSEEPGADEVGATEVLISALRSLEVCRVCHTVSLLQPIPPCGE